MCGNVIAPHDQLGARLTLPSARALPPSGLIIDQPEEDKGKTPIPRRKFRLPGLNRRVFTQSNVSDAISDSDGEGVFNRDADATLTFSTVVLVAALGGSIWFLLWRMSVHLLAGLP